MINFNNVPITDLLEFIVDNRGKSVPVQEKGFPLIATNCIKESSIYPTFENIRYVSDDTLKNWFRAELKPNDILFVNKGTPGRVCLVPNPINFCAAQDMIGLRTNPDKCYYRYLFAVLRSEFIKEKINNFRVGVAIPHFKKSDLKNLLIPLPDMENQLKIGDLYFTLSEKIENNNKIIDATNKFIRDIYDYWFLQFDFPNDEGKPYKTSGGKMIWNEELKIKIPTDWKVLEMGNALVLLKDGTHNPPQRVERGVPLLTGNMFGNMFLNYDKATYISKEDYNLIHKKYQPKKGDIILTKIGTIGNINILRESDIPIAIHCNSALLRFPKEYGAIYSYLMLNSSIFQNQFQAAKGQSVQKFVSLNKIDKIKIVEPTIDIIKRFNNIVEPLYKKNKNLTEENLLLNKTREFLLPLLMSGQVTFKEEV